MMDNAQTIIISERPLTDDELTVADPGYTFKGGYVAILTYHTFAGPWSDQEHVRRFRKMDAARAFIQKRYGADVVADLEDVFI